MPNLPVAPTRGMDFYGRHSCGSVSGQLPELWDGSHDVIERGSPRHRARWSIFEAKFYFTLQAVIHSLRRIVSKPVLSSQGLNSVCVTLSNTLFCNYSPGPCPRTNFDCHPSVSPLIETSNQPGVMTAGAYLCNSFTSLISHHWEIASVPAGMRVMARPPDIFSTGTLAELRRD